jgi:hypothetical protein
MDMTHGDRKDDADDHVDQTARDLDGVDQAKCAPHCPSDKVCQCSVSGDFPGHPLKPDKQGRNLSREVGHFRRGAPACSIRSGNVGRRVCGEVTGLRDSVSNLDRTRMKFCFPNTERVR